MQYSFSSILSYSYWDTNSIFLTNSFSAENLKCPNTVSIASDPQFFFLLRWFLFRFNMQTQCSIYYILRLKCDAIFFLQDAVFWRIGSIHIVQSHPDRRSSSNICPSSSVHAYITNYLCPKVRRYGFNAIVNLLALKPQVIRVFSHNQ